MYGRKLVSSTQGFRRGEIRKERRNLVRKVLLHDFEGKWRDQRKETYLRPNKKRKIFTPWVFT